MRNARKLSEADLYHVMARGVGKQIIFEDDADRERFLGLVRDDLAVEGELLAWCLMDNHFHILVRLEMLRLSDVMRRVLSAYATYFNLRHGRTGHLFQDRFASEAIDTDEYLLEAVRYIHQNPAKAGIAETSEYRWSSYGEYVSGGGMCDCGLVMEMVGTLEEFEAFHAIEGGRAFLEVASTPGRITDAQALDAARGLLGDNPAAEIAALTRPERDGVLRALRQRGLTIKQIQRLTGVGRGVIQRVKM